METTNTTGWWACSDWGTDAELPSNDTTSFRVACPDCAATMVEQWRWETTAA